MTSKSSHIIVIGGGVNGLGIAWRLAEAGCRVSVYDSHAIGPGTRGATWAAGGMVAAGVEAEPGEEALTANIYMFAATSISRKENPRRLETLLNALLPPANRITNFA